MRTQTSDDKLISTDIHGLIDYGAGALALVIPRAIGGSDAAIATGNVAAAFTGVYAATTRYERGIVPVLSMKQHLVLDAAFGLTYITAGLLLRNDTPLVRSMFVAFGLFALWASQNTETVSPTERAEQVANHG